MPLKISIDLVLFRAIPAASLPLVYEKENKLFTTLVNLYLKLNNYLLKLFQKFRTSRFKFFYYNIRLRLFNKIVNKRSGLI